MPELAQKCIASWKKFCPDYEIIQWNDNNFDINAHAYTKSAYQEKKFGFVPEFARFYVVYHNGGIYLDNDVELLKNLDDLLNQEAFIGTEKFGALINSGSGYGAIKHSKIIGELLNIYEKMPFENEDGVLNMTPGPSLVTPVLLAKGWKPDNTKQTIQGLTIYPTDYFCPKDYDKVLRITSNTYSIHHFAGSWVDEKMKADFETQKKLAKLFGPMGAVSIWYLVKIYRRKGFLHILKRSPFLIKKFLASRAK